jgi:segregation and condensation protein B
MIDPDALDMPDDADEYDESEGEGVSLEELSQSYARLLRTEEQDEPSLATNGEAVEPELELFDADDDSKIDDAHAVPVTPLSILEAVLLVGHPDNVPITAAEIANLMRGVSPTEVEQLIDELNRVYEESKRAWRVVEAGVGFRMQLANDLKFITDRFYGQVRDVRLNQAAIDCLALVAYQPGISRKELEEQRGQPSGSVLNQLVRRQLLEIRREGKELTTHYHPTERLLKLAGLASLEDLPQVEEWQ